VGKWGGGGVALEIESFVGPVKLQEPIGECNFGPTKLYAVEAAYRILYGP
jgi:hypothetical protein